MAGGGGGHIADMVARYKANMSWLTKKRYFNKLTGKYENRHADWNDDFHKMTPAELKNLRKQLIFEKRKEHLKLILILIISIAIGTWGMYWIFS